MQCGVSLVMCIISNNRYIPFLASKHFIKQLLRKTNSAKVAVVIKTSWCFMITNFNFKILTDFVY